jgi:hypothetical protein
MTNDEKKKLFKILSAPFTEEAIERTEGRVTGRGYNTTGIKSAYIVARLNEVLGVGSYRTEQTTTVRESTTAKGRTAFDATCELELQLGEWIDGKFFAFAESHATGGHQSMSEADARKGAYSNGFKKAAAMFGCGQQAYMGTLDDDNVPADETFSAPPRQAQQRPQAIQETRPQQPPPQASRPPQSSPATSQPGPSTSAEQPIRRQSSEEPSGAGGGSRTRLTAKQLAAIWALARKLNYAQQEFRQIVRKRFNCQPEFLDRNAASTVIGELSARASNGSSHPAGESGAAA